MTSIEANSEVSAWDGTISECEFRGGALDFAEKWNNLDHSLPPWSWIQSSTTNLPLISSINIDGYLALEKMCFFKSNKIDDDEVDLDAMEEKSCLEHEDSPDCAIFVQESYHGVHYYDFHIVYSSSYRVPLLYFRGYNEGTDGQPLGFDDVEKDLPASSAKVLTESKWTFITQQEHPYLKRPWFTLHPCGTSEVMKLLFSNHHRDAIAARAKEYVTSWFSVVGQVVGLRVPLQIAALACTR